MDLTLRHVGVLVADLQRSLAFYQGRLGLHQVSFDGACRLPDDTRVLTDGVETSRAWLKLSGPPFAGADGAGTQRAGSGYGCGVHALGFAADDLNACAAGLADAGTEYAWSDDEAGVPCLGFSGPDDVCLTISQTGAAAGVPSQDPHPRIYEFHHFCHTSMHHLALEPFYAGVLGMRRVRTEPEEGMIFLAAAGNVDRPERSLMPLELFGPPGLWDLDEAFLARHGPGFQYLCFAVDDVDSAHAELCAAGVPCTLAPQDYGATRITFFRDPDGVDIEILQRSNVVTESPSSPHGARS